MSGGNGQYQIVEAQESLVGGVGGHDLLELMRLAHCKWMSAQIRIRRHNFY